MTDDRAATALTGRKRTDSDALHRSTLFLLLYNEPERG